jgi:hypothetical protein
LFPLRVSICGWTRPPATPPSDRLHNRQRWWVLRWIFVRRTNKSLYTPSMSDETSRRGRQELIELVRPFISISASTRVFRRALACSRIGRLSKRSTLRKKGRGNGRRRRRRRRANHALFPGDDERLARTYARLHSMRMTNFSRRCSRSCVFHEDSHTDADVDSHSGVRWCHCRCGCVYALG